MWPEIDVAKKENRHEIILSGKLINERISKDGLDKSLFTVKTLNYLNINGTSISEIPDEISQLNSLQTLVLHTNKLCNLNPNIKSLDKLKVVDLSGNELVQIPDIFEFLPNIVTLNFSRNKLNSFPRLSKNSKLSVLDLSNNELSEFPDILHAALINLSELKLNGNQIASIPDEINNLTALKILQINSNKITTIPGNLVECTKLKDVNLKENPIADKRLLKLIDQCRTKQVLDYVKQHCATDKNSKKSKKNDTANENGETPKKANLFKFKLSLIYAKSAQFEVVVTKKVENVRKYIACCIIQGVKFDEISLKKWIQLQNKLHETLCDKRNAATIATHDYKKLGEGNLVYTTMKPEELKIKPLNRNDVMTGKELFEKLQTEAQNLRKEKKRNTYSGIHKYLYLIEGKSEYPCLLNSKSDVISFPPITNSDISKIEVGSTDIFVEVSSSTSLVICKKILDTLIRETVLILENNLSVLQIKTVDEEGNLKNVYPSKNDLNFENEKIIEVIRE